MDNEDDTFKTERRSDCRRWFAQKRLVIMAIIIGIVVLCVIVGLAVGLRDDDIGEKPYGDRLERAKRVLGSYPLVDGHNDLAWQYRRKANLTVYGDSAPDLDAGWPDVHTDIPRIRQGKLGGQFWAAFVHCNSSYKDAVRQTLDQIDVIKKFVDRYSETFEWVTTAQGIEDAFLKRGKVGSLIGLEGGHSIDSSLGNLRMMYELGVRYMTVTHSCNTPWADNWHVDEPDYKGTKIGGLTAFGKMVIREMNRLGMIIDLSHVSKDVMVQTLQHSLAPVIFSHSSAFAICNHYRNVQDDVLQQTKTNKGVVMVNFYTPYINCFPNNITGNGNISQVADHIDHIKHVIGIDHIGIGADYDGVPTLPEGLEDVSTYPALFAELVKRKYSNEDLEKLAGRNVVRVFRDVEKLRDSLKERNAPPNEDRIATLDENYNKEDYVPECRTDY